ncbi:hypothetical protein AB0E67_11020 [Streptomyces sp. NPDC032161]
MTPPAVWALAVRYCSVSIENAVSSWYSALRCATRSGARATEGGVSR